LGAHLGRQGRPVYESVGRRHGPMGCAGRQGMAG
jgi:hypothetical protein